MNTKTITEYGVRALSICAAALVVFRMSRAFSVPMTVTPLMSDTTALFFPAQKADKTFDDLPKFFVRFFEIDALEGFSRG